MIEVNFCENNLSHGTDEVVNRLENEVKSVHIGVESCLGYCSDCAMQPFALVDDELILADTPDELYDKIMEKI